MSKCGVKDCDNLKSLGSNFYCEYHKMEYEALGLPNGITKYRVADEVMNEYTKAVSDGYIFSFGEYVKMMLKPKKPTVSSLIKSLTKNLKSYFEASDGYMGFDEIAKRHINKAYITGIEDAIAELKSKHLHSGAFGVSINLLKDFKKNLGIKDD